MHHSLSFRLPRLFCAAACALACAALQHDDLRGQTFQSVFGNPDCEDAARCVVYDPGNGINSGWLAVGTSRVGQGCTNSDVYVVRTNLDGTLAWSFTYDLQGQDSANAVVHCTNGDFVITGSTNDAVGTRQLFLLRISATGAVLFTNILGRPGLNVVGTALTESFFGNGTFTNVGDIVVVGWIGSIGSRDALLMRTNASLTQLWNTVLRGAGPDLDDYLYGVEEARMSPGPGGTADIVAVGGTSSWGSGGTDVYILRVDNFGLPRAAAVVGGPLNDEAHSVAEIRALPFLGVPTGDFAIAGSTHSHPGHTNNDAYVLEVDSSVTLVRGNVIFGDQSRDDEANAILFDIHSTPLSLLTTGYTNVQSGGLLAENVFLQRLTTGTVTLTPGAKLYGGTGNDRGYGLALNGPFCAQCPPQTLGYAVAGFTASPDLIAPDPQQVYMLKTNVALQTGCHEDDVSYVANRPFWPLLRVVPVGLSILFIPAGAVTRTSRDWFTPLCTFPVDGGRAMQRGGGEDGVAGLGGAPHDAEATSALAYPNPLRIGANLNVRLELQAASATSVTVTDMLGHIVFRRDGSFAAGSTLVIIPSGDWLPGTYIVSVAAGDRTTEQKVVVTGH